MIRVITFFIAVVFFALPARAELDIEEVTSPGGITAWLVNEPSIPFIAMDIGFKGGATLDPDGKEGVTSMMMGLLEEGTGDMDAAAFSRASEALAADYGFDSSRASVSVSVRTLKSNASESLALLKQAMVAPAFNDAAIERVRAQMLSILASDETDPDEIAGRALREMAFAGHPYQRPADGTVESVKTITRDDLVAAHRAAMVKDKLFIGVVGDVTAEELGPMLDAFLGDLPESGGGETERVDFGASGGITVVEFDQPQSVAVWGQKGIERDDPLFFPAFVMNHILGGGSFSSRLTNEVREKRGLTYGVYSYVANMTHADFVGGSVSSANDRIAEAIEVVKAEWQRMAEEGVTEEELAKAKKYLTGNYPLRFDGNAQIATILKVMQLQGLPIDYPINRNDKVNAVTVEQVAEVAKRLLKVDELRFVVVGKPVGLTSTD